MSLPPVLSHANESVARIDLPIELSQTCSLSMAECVRVYIKCEIFHFRKFVLKPVRSFNKIPATKERWARVALFCGIGILFNGLYLLTIGVALDTWTSLEFRSDMTDKAIIFSALILAPILEELICRAGLRSAKYSLFFGPIFIVTLIGAWQIALSLFFFLMTIVLVHEYLLPWINNGKKPGQNFFLGRSFIQAYPKIFWMYAGAFSLMHVMNFSINNVADIAVVFAVIPQFVMGILWGYVRIRDGIASAIFLHFLNNFIWVSLINMSS
jgi:membrane protease YdiL (CAAX protease family)